jgi:hypothetical protein
MTLPSESLSQVIDGVNMAGRENLFRRMSLERVVPQNEIAPFLMDNKYPATNRTGSK